MKGLVVMVDGIAVEGLAAQHLDGKRRRTRRLERRWAEKRRAWESVINDSVVLAVHEAVEESTLRVA